MELKIDKNMIERFKNFLVLEEKKRQHAGIIRFYSGLFDFFGISYLLRLQCVTNIANFTLTPLCSGSVKAHFYLLLDTSTLRTFFLFIYSCFSHSSSPLYYFTITPLTYPLPVRNETQILKSSISSDKY